MDLRPNISLDQLATLLLVAESGGFTAAARASRRTQGAVSYHIGKLEEQLGLTLFDRSGYRPELTPAGESIVKEARQVLDQVDVLLGAAELLATGLESRVTLTVDVLFPPARLAALFTAFEARFPPVDLVIRSAVWADVIDDLVSGVADLAIAPPDVIDSTMTATVFTTTEFVPVAAPTHPLAALAGPISKRELDRHRRIVIVTKRAVPSDPVKAKVLRLDNPGTRRGMLIEGLGWSRLPRFEVEADLLSGRLVELPVRDWLGLPEVRLAVVTVVARPLGPAARWVADYLLAS